METISSSINYPKPSKNENVEIFVRLRGYTKLPSNFIKRNKKESKGNSKLEPYSNNQRIKNIKSTTRESSNDSLQNKKTNNKKKNLTESNENKKKLIFNYLYYMFTSYPKCNKLVITQDALNGTCIMNSVRNERDILDINKTILGNASIYEYDNCFCETEDLCDVYLQTVESKIIKLFQGINSCFFVAGPSRSGKSYTMFGTIKIKGVIAYTIDKILYLIDYMNNNNNNTENENENENNNNNEDNFEKDDSNENNENNNSKLMLSFIIEQYYLDEKEIIFEETIIFEIKDFYSIIANLQQRRRDIAQMHNIQYMESKSNLILTFTIYKINTKTDIKKLIENNNIEELKEDNSIEPFSKISFIELNDSLYGFAPASAPTTLLYKESSKVYNDMVNISIALSKGNAPEIIRTKMLTELCENVIFRNSHIMILICASPCDPNINVSGNCLIWGYSLRNRLNYSKMINKGYFITNCPSIYVDNNKFKESCLKIANFSFSIIEKNKKRKKVLKNDYIESKTQENFRDKLNEENSMNFKSDTSKRFQTEGNWLFSNTNSSENNLISKYKLLQNEINKIKKQREIENKQNTERFKSLEKLIQKVKKTNKEKEEKEEKI
jgi:hypothetical protein